jgi:rRNA processing protein Gar1
MATSDPTLGTVVDVVRDGSLLVESPPRDGPMQDPPLGEDAVDQRHAVVGTVVDVVGPVHAPYFLLDPDGSNSGTGFVGKEVYAPSASRGDG